MASEVCLIDHDANKASAEAEDIQHVGFFLGCPLVTGTSGTTTNVYVYFYSNFSPMLSKHGSTNFGIISSAWKWRIDKSVREIPEILGSWGNPFPWTCNGSRTTAERGRKGGTDFWDRHRFRDPRRPCPLISSLIYIAVISPSVSPSFSPVHS